MLLLKPYEQSMASTCTADGWDPAPAQCSLYTCSSLLAQVDPGVLTEKLGSTEPQDLSADQHVSDKHLMRCPVQSHFKFGQDFAPDLQQLEIECTLE